MFTLMRGWLLKSILTPGSKFLKNIKVIHVRKRKDGCMHVSLVTYNVYKLEGVQFINTLPSVFSMHTPLQAQNNYVICSIHVM